MRKHKCSPAAAVASAFLAGAAILGCEPMETTQREAPRPAGAPAPDLAEVEGKQTPPVDVPGEDLRALADGNNEFALALYRRLAQEGDGNLILSPYSISSALAMTYAGAQGQTAEQMAEVLRFRLDGERLHRAFAGATQQAQSGGKRQLFRLHIANALWGQQGYGFAEPFLDLTRRYYGAGLREVDFAGDTEAARRTINRWVEERTEEKITDLLQPQDLSLRTRLVLTNAIYFKGTWHLPFPESRTKEEDFEVKPGERVKVPMMHQKQAQLRYHATPELHLLELPYRGERFAMVVLLPAERGRLGEVEENLTAEKLREGLSELQIHRGSVALPRFDFASRFSLKDVLRQMGMTLAFSEGADFSGISPKGGLRISDVIHTGFVAVDEKGTEAAAATAVVMTEGLAQMKFTFRADHPFLFLILDRTTESILFLGRVTDPR